VKVQIDAKAATNNDIGEETDEGSDFPDVDRGSNDRLRSTNGHHGTTQDIDTVRGQLGVLRAP
jgi:hypothetical protein